MKPRRGKKGMKGMERIGQYCPEESVVRKVTQRSNIEICFIMHAR